MPAWQVFSIIGAVMLIIEMLTPTMFCLNIAIAAFITAIASVFVDEWPILICIMLVLSMLLLVFIYPILVKKNKAIKIANGVNTYIGKKAKVVEAVTKDSGAISIYDERWNARIEDGKDIAVGEMVEIYKNESVIFYVRKG